MSIELLQEFVSLPNIAVAIKPEILTEIGDMVVQGYDDDEASRKDWLEKSKEYMNLAMQVCEKKTSPWEGASNVKFPLITEAAMQFNARAYPALITGSDIVKARVVGEDHDGQKNNAATRVSRHMSYQIMEEMEDWEEGHDKMLLALPIIGSMFKKTYFDPILEQNKSETVYPKDLVVDYYTKSLSTCYRITHKIPMTDQELQPFMRAGIFLNVELSEPKVREQSSNVNSTTPPPAGKCTPRDILEQHTYYDLDGDGYAEPYIITVEYESKQVLRILANYDVEQIKLTEEQVIIYIPKKEYFTKYGFIPNPDGGFYDIGMGQLLGPISDTVDTAINQLLDAGSMSTLQAGFLSRNIRLPAGNMRFRPNEWKQVNTTGDDLRKGIFPLPTKEPSGVLFNLLGMMINEGQRVSSTVDSMMGENPGQNQKATTTLSVIEQGSKVFNAIHKRLHRSFKQELKKLALLNYYHLDPAKYFQVLDPKLGEEEFQQVFQSDYNPQSLNIIPAADSNIATQQQKLAKAQGLMELLQTGLIDPMETVQRILEAEEQPSIEKLLKQPQPPQPDFETQLKIDQFKFESMMRQREFALEVIKVKQQDVTVRTNAILTLAKAEAEEQGPSIEIYKEQLKALTAESKSIGDQAGEVEQDFSELFDAEDSEEEAASGEEME